MTVRCLLEAKELNDALQVANLIDVETFTPLTAPQTSALEGEIFDDTPKHVSATLQLIIVIKSCIEK